MLTLISMLVWGLIAGALARLLMPGPDSFTWTGTMILGIVGSFVGGLIGALFTGKGIDTINPAGLIMSVIGSLVALAIYRRMSAKKG
jgi:uncharacterized membrane protein YeaQ/YmgE (transglycosylase-associated protein family)